jgi:beta-glucosidase
MNRIQSWRGWVFFFAVASSFLVMGAAEPDVGVPTVTSLLQGNASSADMALSDCTRPEERPEKIEKKAHSLAKQLKEMEAMKSACDLLLVGDSLTADWKTNPEAWKVLTGDLKAVNTGVGGETIQGMLYRLREWPADLNPRVVSVLCGANNPAYHVHEIAAGTVALVEAILKKWPEARVILVGMPPRGSAPEDALCAKVADVNRITAKIADGRKVRYFDLWEHFTYRGDRQGFVGVKFEPKDKLHLTPEGYNLWAQAMKPLLGKD